MTKTTIPPRRSWYLTTVFAALFGSFGFHRFYTGHIKTAMMQCMGSITAFVLSLFAYLYRAPKLSTVGKVISWCVLLWVLIDIVQLLRNRWRNPQGELIERAQGDGKRLLIGIGIAVVILGLLLGPMFFTKSTSTFVQIYRNGGHFMQPIAQLGLVLILLLSMTIPYGWHPSQPSSTSDQLWLSSLFALFFTMLFVNGTLGTYFGLAEVLQALSSTSVSQVAQLGAQYLSITLIARYTALGFVGLAAMLGAWGAAILCLHSPTKHWWRLGVNLALVLGTLFFASKLYPKLPHALFPFKLWILALLPLALSSLSDPTSEAESTTDGHHATTSLAPLFAGLSSALAVFALGFSSSEFLLSEFSKSLDSATAETKAQLLNHFGSLSTTVWHATLMLTPLAALIGLWFLFSSPRNISSVVQSLRTRLLLPLLLPLLIVSGLLFFQRQQIHSTIDHLQRYASRLHKASKVSKLQLMSIATPSQQFNAANFLSLNQEQKLSINGIPTTPQALSTKKKLLKSKEFGLLVDKHLNYQQWLPTLRALLPYCKKTPHCWWLFRAKDSNKQPLKSSLLPIFHRLTQFHRNHFVALGFSIRATAPSNQAAGLHLTFTSKGLQIKNHGKLLPPHCASSPPATDAGQPPPPTCPWSPKATPAQYRCLAQCLTRNYAGISKDKGPFSLHVEASMQRHLNAELLRHIFKATFRPSSFEMPQNVYFVLAPHKKTP